VVTARDKTMSEFDNMFGIVIIIINCLYVIVNLCFAFCVFLFYSCFPDIFCVQCVCKCVYVYVM